MKNFFLFSIILISLCLYEDKIFPESTTLNFYTSDRLAPHVILNDGKLGGMIGEFILEALTDKYTINTINLPWIRAQYEFEKNKNSIISPMGRTKERENKMAWVTKIYDDPVCLFTMKPNKKIITKEDMMALKKIALTLGVGHISKAREIGFDKKIVNYHSSEADAKALKSGEVNAWLSGTITAYYYWEQLKFNLSELQCGTPINSQQIFIATSLNSDKSFIETLAKNFENYKKTKKYKKLLEKYSVTYYPYLKTE